MSGQVLLAVAPHVLNGLRVGSSLWVYKILLVVDWIVQCVLKLNMFTQFVVCTPGIWAENCTIFATFIDDWKKHFSRTALIHLFKPAIQSASLNKAKNPFILILPPFHMSSSVLWSCGKKGFIKFYNLTKTSKFWGVSAHASNRYSDAPPSKTLKASAWNEAWKLVRIHQTDITMLHLQKHWNPLYGRNHRC